MPPIVAGALVFIASAAVLVLEILAVRMMAPYVGISLERDNPGLRKQMAEAGAPERFEDVVATINPIPDDQPDTPAHWSVTFAVADADAAAAKATELGGTVLVPPFDPPWVRMTALADPQGATFIASRFTPEDEDLGSPAAAVG
jgi:hypothetical protein